MSQIYFSKRLALFAVWISLYVIPLLVVWDHCRGDMGLCPLRFHHIETRIVLLSLLFVFILETLLLLSVLSLAARSKAAIFVAWIFLNFYFTSLSLSTFRYSAQGKFLTSDHLSLIPYILDPVFLRFNVVTRDELVFIQSLFIGAIISTLWLLTGVKFINLSKTIAYRQLSIIGGALSLIFLFPPGPKLLDQSSLSFARTLATNNISPQLSFGWSRMFFGPAEPTFRNESAELVPIGPDLKTVESKVTKRKQNILVFVVEAIRSDILSVGHGDNSKVMPFSKNIMSNSIIYENAYATAPETEGSMFSIITGLYPLRGESRHYGGTNFFPMTRIYDLLSQSGYRSGYFTWEWESMRWFTKSNYLDIHQDPYLIDPEVVRNSLPPEIANKNPPENYLVPNGDRYNIAELKNWITNPNDNRPFFGITYLFSSHFAHTWPNEMLPPFQPFILDLDPSFLTYPEHLTPIVKNRYFNSLRFIDDLIADAFDHLKKNNLLENTTIIITGDHGELFHEHGQVTHAGFLHEPAIRVPLIFYNLPAGLCAPDKSSPVSLLDLAPTLLTLADLPPHPNFQGQSIIDPCNLPNRDPSPVFSSVQLITQEDAVIQWPWKYIRNYTSDQNRLFNLETDPGENINLANSSVEQEDKLDQLIKTFRNRQLTYYGDDQISRKYYPPKISTNFQSTVGRRKVH